MDIILYEHNRAQKQKDTISGIRKLLFAGAGLAGGLKVHKMLTGSKKTLVGKLMKK